MRDAFLVLTKVKEEVGAMSNSIMAALQHNQTYLQSATDSDKKEFRETLANQIRKYATSYYQPISDETHSYSMCEICNYISMKHGNILADQRLRLGTVQKAFNLYLKFLWCLDQNRADPPHCPVDRIILNHAGINGVWTKLDSAELYKDWIHRLKKVAKEDGFSSLQQWELSIWSKALEVRGGINRGQPLTMAK